MMRRIKNGKIRKHAVTAFGPVPIAAMVLTMVLATGILPAQGAQELRGDASHRGVIDVSPFQIFPEKRPDNAVYIENRLIFTVPNETLTDILPLPKEGRFAYVATNAEGTTRMGLFLQPQDRQLRLTDLGQGYSHGVMALDGVIFKKLYRLTDGTLRDLVPSSKTPDGAQAGEPGVVFFHVAAMTERDGLDGTPVKEFGLRLHLSLYEEERVRELGYLVENTLPQVQLIWTDSEHISYTLADGRSEVISVAQFQ